ncbi:unnamed protein product [Rhizoctonia solani]|uniref:Uncharacterized protein n=1 Tax=Rhizoctonia solani TaxID=456999 RepID=A0A8H3DN88_9AGAM|nr:unnamed protein product [Rhizoctonia solani]
MGRRIQLTPPRASVAAIMVFMVKLERNGPIPTRPAPVIPNLPADIQQLAHPGLTVYPRTRYPAFNGPGSTEFDGRVNRIGSAAYDIEWRRMLQCGNPFANLRFKAMPIFRPGDLAGDWEGRFVYFTPDAFWDMIAGVHATVTSAPIAQQPHIWRIREHHLVHRRRRTPLGREDDEVTGEILPVGAALDAYIPQAAQFIHHGEPSEFSTRRLEVRIPDSTTPLGYRSYNYTTLDGPNNISPTQIQASFVVPESPSTEMDVDVDMSLDWDQPQPPRLGDGDDEFDEKVMDTLITGEGQSPQGPFKLRGRVRTWDGLIIFAQEYNFPTVSGLGHLLYKGHLVSGGGNWVGRWRDSLTPVQFSGYEGLFSVTRHHS